MPDQPTATGGKIRPEIEQSSNSSLPLLVPAKKAKGGSLPQAPELYAKVIRPLDESTNRYVIHFTSVSPGMRERIRLFLEARSYREYREKT